MRKLHVRYIVLAAVTILGSQSMAGIVTRKNIIRSSTASTVYGAYILGETQPSANHTDVNPTRAAGGYAVSPNATGPATMSAFALNAPLMRANALTPLRPSTNSFYVGAISDGSADTVSGTGFFGGGFGQYDALGFTVGYNPHTPGQINVTRRVLADAVGASDGTGTTNLGYVDEMGLGSVANNGDLALKLLISTSPSSNSFGLINAASPATSVFTTSYVPTNSAQWRPIVTATATSDSVQSVGGSNGWVWSSTFSKQLIAGTTSSTVSGAYTPHGRVVATIAGADKDIRGSVTYNDKIGLAAALRVTIKHFGAVNVPHCTDVAIYKVTFDGSGNPELRDLTGAISTNGTEVKLPQNVATQADANSDTNSMDMVGTNYFSSTGFTGPAQISMNDHGDIALATVAVNVDDTTDTSQNQERGYEYRKYYVVNHYNGSNAYNGWVIAAQSGTNAETTDGSGNMFSEKGTGDFVSVNPALPPPGNGAASIAHGNPSLDNSGNVYFQACYEAIEFAGFASSTYHPAIFRSKTSDGINYTTEEVLAEEDTISNPAGSGLGQRITFMPLSVATSSLLNLNIRFPAGNSFSTSSGRRDGKSGLVVACKVTDQNDDPNNPVLPSRWAFVYVDYK